MDSSVEKFQNSQWQKLKELNFSKTSVLGLISDGSVLDIGCGDGLLLEYLKKAGLQGIGVDVSSVAIDICKERGLDCRVADITNRLPFDDNSFDNVVLTDVLEHIFQPMELLREAHRVCRGYIFISVPNFASLPARLQVFFGKVPENNTPRDGHVYWMTYNVLRGLLTGAGFKIEKIQTNTFWENNMIFGPVMKMLKTIRPSLFAVSFIVKAKKI